MLKPRPDITPDTPSAGHMPIMEDREAFFARIVHEHARLLYRVAHSVLRHSQDAEDAVQDALLKLYRGEAWRTMQDERAFLCRVVWRAALDRHIARTPGAEAYAELFLVDVRPTPAEAAERDDDRARLQQWIDELPAELREPLVLSAIEELRSPQIAAMLGVPEGTVRTRLMRARERLKQKYQAMDDAGREVAAGGRRRG